MTRLGADVDQLDQLARSFDAAAERIEYNANIIEWQLRSLWWSGSTADRFTASWASTDRKRLSLIAATLRDVGAKVQVQAHQQRAASASGGAYGIRLGHWAGLAASPHFDGTLEMSLQSILLGIDVADHIRKLVNTPILKKFVGTAAFLAAGYDLLYDRRDDGLAWIESGADILSMAVPLLVAANPALGLGVAIAAFSIDGLLWVHDNWEAVTDFAEDVGEAVVDAASWLVSPAVEAVETVVDVTETVVDVVGDGIEAIGDGIEAVGSVVSGAGRLIGGWFS